MILGTISCSVSVKNNHSIPQKVWLFIQSFTIICSVTQAYSWIHKGESDRGDFLLSTVWRERWNCKAIIATWWNGKRGVYKVPRNLKNKNSCLGWHPGLMQERHWREGVLHTVYYIMHSFSSMAKEARTEKWIK